MGSLGVVVVVILLFVSTIATASYNRTPDSDIDPSVFLIKQEEYLGKKISGDLILLDRRGAEFPISEKFGKPLILVLSYYSCDGACSVTNLELMRLLENIERFQIGDTYNVLTVSFDAHDTSETAEMFFEEMGMPANFEKGWTIARFKESEEIKPFTSSLGYEYFWSPRDRTFYHPNIFIFITPEGRVSRYLYSSTIKSRDVELALIETAQGEIKPTEITTLALGFCYSYNYKDGKYSLNIPLFIAFGSLCFGISLFIGSVFVFKKKRKSMEVKL